VGQVRNKEAIFGLLVGELLWVDVQSAEVLVEGGLAGELALV